MFAEDHGNYEAVPRSGLQCLVAERREPIRAVIVKGAQFQGRKPQDSVACYDPRRHACHPQNTSFTSQIVYETGCSPFDGVLAFVCVESCDRFCEVQSPRG